jgi:hypothetical protein
VAQPTSKPFTTVPTTTPTFYPTSSPTLPVNFQYAKKTNLVTGVEMQIALKFSRRLQGSSNTTAPSSNEIKSTAQCIRLWQDKVQDGIRAQVNSTVPNVETVDVYVTNISQQLQIETSILTFLYNVEIDIRSPVQNYDVNQFITGPLDTTQEQTDFARYLRSTNCTVYTFATTAKVILPSNSLVPSQGGQQSSPSKRQHIGLIVGVIFAAVAVAMLVALFLVNRERQGNANSKQQAPSSPLADMDAHDDGFLSRIGMQVSPDGDVSTLSDPIPLHNAIGIPKDETSTIGSFSLDYDYQKAYLGSVSDVQSFGDDDEPRMYISADDETLFKQVASEEAFEISAPAGTLGLVLEASEDSVPVVSGIRSNSVLVNEIKIGDRLLSVDGQDVTEMLTSEVSKLIASKRHQPIRRMVFIRPVAKAK